MNKNTATKQLKKLIDLKSMPKNEARVAIAQDVLAGLKLEKIISRGGYFHATRKDYMNAEAVPLRDQLPAIKQCDVCAVGSLFVAQVARDNKFNVDVFDGVINLEGSEIFCHLKTYFSIHQLRKIENWFEYYTSAPCSEAWEDLDSIDRMRLIMQNIVQNNGTFIPSRLPREYQR